MQELNKFIDATVLGGAVKSDDVTGICEDTRNYYLASACFPSYFLSEIRQSYDTIKLCTVIGFPHGIQSIAAKVQEVEDAIASGADELDIVVSLTAIQNDNLGYLEEEINKLLEVKQDKLYKLILESGLWTEAILTKVVEFYSKFDVEFLKTSTGFIAGGATTEAVKIMMSKKSSAQQVKASGGIRTYEQGLQFVNMGVTRLGTSQPKNLLIPS